MTDVSHIRQIAAADNFEVPDAWWPEVAGLLNDYADLLDNAPLRAYWHEADPEKEGDTSTWFVPVDRGGPYVVRRLSPLEYVEALGDGT